MLTPIHADLSPHLFAYVPVCLARLLCEKSEPLVEPTTHSFLAAVLVTDISGFTALTAALGHEGPRGVEELTEILNTCFGLMITLIEAEGGDVVKFGGDALTALFIDETPGHAVRRAQQAAEAVQAAISSLVLSSSIGGVSLGLRVGIGAGTVLIMQVGGVLDRWECVIGGDALAQAQRAEMEGAPNQVRLSPEAQAVLHPVPLGPRSLERPDWSAVPDLQALEAALRCYIPFPVRDWLRGDLHDWLAVFRPMTVAFVRVQFGAGLCLGPDRAQPAATEVVQAILSEGLRILYHYEGCLARASLDEQGLAMLVFFGAAPLVHEDDPVRAVRCVLDIQSAIASGQWRGLQVGAGIASGHLFAGPVGSSNRCEYTVMGEAVNLAARLVQVAKADQVICDYETLRRAEGICEFETMAAVRVKGLAGLVRIYRPTGRVATDRQTFSELVGRGRRSDWDPGLLLGREAEVARLADALAAVQAGEGQVLVVQGEAGIGKSRLIIELTRQARQAGLTWLAGAGKSVEQQTPYRAWRDVFSYYLGLDTLDNVTERQDRVRSVVEELVQGQRDDLAVLNDVLNVGLPESDAMRMLDPAARRQRLFTMLLALLEAWAREQPLILILEDAHWLDTLSWELVIRVAQTLLAENKPLLLVLVVRPFEVHDRWRGSVQALQAVSRTQILSLDTLSPEATVALVAAHLGLASGELPDPVADLIRRRSGGNPFFALELAFALRDRGLIELARTEEGMVCSVLVHAEFARAAETLSGTLRGLIMARVDRLLPESQLVIRIASVIGQIFTYQVLRHTITQYIAVSDAALLGWLDELAELELTPLYSPPPALAYRFRHTITREVTYDSLLFAQRRAIHRVVADALEQVYPERIGEMVGLLALHWEQAEEWGRAIVYLLRAGEQSQKAYANREAIAYLDRALVLLDQYAVKNQADDSTIPYSEWRLMAVRCLGQIYLGMGQLQEANDRLHEAIVLGRELGLERQVLLRLYYWLGEVLWWQGHRQEHLQIGQEALALLGDDVESVEAALINQTMAVACLGSGDHAQFWALTLRTAQFIQRLPYSEELRSAYTHIVITYRERRMPEEALRWLRVLEEKASPSQDQRALAEVHLYMGSILGEMGVIEEGIAHWKRALDLFGQIEDDKHQGWCMTALALALIAVGDLDAARGYAQQGIEVAAAIGLRDYLRLAYRCLGLVALCERRYDEAVRHLAESVRLGYETQMPVETALALTLMGRTYLLLGDSVSARAALKETFGVFAEEQAELPYQAVTILAAALSAGALLPGFEEQAQAILGGGRLSQWSLIPPDANRCGGGGCYAAFDRTTGENWQDALLAQAGALDSCAVEQGGGVTIHAANGRDLEGINTSAPRMWRQVEGDWMAYAVCVPLPSKPGVGGILLWRDRDHYVCLERGAYGPNEVLFSGCLATRETFIGRESLSMDRAADVMYLCLERKGNVLRAFCSADGVHCCSVGQAAFGTAGPLWLGIYAAGRIDRGVYPGAHVHGTAMHFQRFEVRLDHS